MKFFQSRCVAAGYTWNPYCIHLAFPNDVNVIWGEGERGRGGRYGGEDGRGGRRVLFVSVCLFVCPSFLLASLFVCLFSFFSCLFCRSWFSFFYFLSFFSFLCFVSTSSFIFFAHFLSISVFLYSFLSHFFLLFTPFPFFPSSFQPLIPVVSNKLDTKHPYRNQTLCSALLSLVSLCIPTH